MLPTTKTSIERRAGLSRVVAIAPLLPSSTVPIALVESERRDGPRSESRGDPSAATDDNEPRSGYRGDPSIIIGDCAYDDSARNDFRRDLTTTPQRSRALQKTEAEQKQVKNCKEKA